MRAKLCVIALVAALPGGCGGQPSPSAPPTEVTVYAAASLQRSFTTMGQRFEAEHPDTKVKFVFGGSSDLVSQLSAGAPGDVLATADQATMAKAQQAGLVEAPHPFATNNLVIATAPGNPKHIASLADLAKQGTLVALCAPQVPCGAASKKVLDLAAVQLRPVTEENSVTNVLTKVTAGEVDAGLVYRTDAAGAGAKVSAVEFGESARVTNNYPIAVLTGSKQRQRAEAFAGWVLSPAGRGILGEAGFGAPAG